MDNIKFIKDNYKNKTKEEMAHILNITRNQIEWIMKKNNIKKYESKKYSEDEINFIKQNYPKYGSKYCANKLNRSENAINKKIKKMRKDIFVSYADGSSLVVFAKIISNRRGSKIFQQFWNH